MKKSVWLVVFITVVLLAGNVIGQFEKKKFAMLKPGGDKQSEILYLTAKQARALQNKPTKLSKYNDLSGIIDTLQHIPRKGIPFFGGVTGDTFAVYFSPPAGSKILEVGFNVGYRLNDRINYPDLWDNIYVSLNFVNYDGKSEAGASGKYLLGEWNGNLWMPAAWYGANYSGSPVGARFWGSYPVKIIPDPLDADEIVRMEWLGQEADNLGKDFAVIFVAHSGSDGGFDDLQSTNLTREQRVWKWYRSDNKWYLRHLVAFYVYCIIEFYENTPPVLTPGGPYGSILTPDARTLECYAVDIDAENEANAGIAEANIVYKVNDFAWQKAPMNLARGTNTEGLWKGDVPAGTLAPGDVLTFYFEMTDGGGLTATTDEASYGYFKNEAKILFYYNDFAQSVNPNYYWNQAPNLHDFWNGVLDGPATSALVDPYRFIVRVDGYSPQNLDSDVLAAWLATGTVAAPKCIFWSSQEFLGVENDWNDTVFPETDWHNRYLGIAAVKHDLQVTTIGSYDQPWPINAVIDNVISGNLARFVADSGWQLLHNMPYEFGNWEWSDGLIAGTDAVACFTGKASGIPIGLHKETATTKSVFLAFDQMALDLNPPSNTGNYVLPEYGYGATGLSIIVPTLEWFNAPLAVAEPNPGIITKYNLYQNFPNPFNSETIIAYSIEKPGRVKLAVYNMLGQKVAELVNDHQLAGKYYVTWNADDISSGIYFYRLATDDYASTKKMMLLR